jgi:hypothetical protein
MFGPPPTEKLEPGAPPRRGCSRLTAYGLPALSALLLAAGCVGQESVREQTKRAYEAGFKQGQLAAELKLTHVFIRGPVQQPTVRWRDGLTLAQALVEAVYSSPNEPRAINLTRRGRTTTINPADLLSGSDPPLEAGDLIELH